MRLSTYLIICAGVFVLMLALLDAADRAEQQREARHTVQELLDTRFGVSLR